MTNRSIGERPHLVVIAELTGAQLDASSGYTNPDTGRPMRVLDWLDTQERERGAQGVFLSGNGMLSPEAHKQNKETRLAGERTLGAKPDAGIVYAVVSRRPPPAG